MAGAIVSALVVAVTAFSASYQHQYELNIREGQAHWVAGMQPLSVEGLIAATTLTIWFSAVIKRRARTIWPAYLVLLVALSQASLMNLAADHRFRWPWIGPEISIWPAAAFFAAYEMAVWIMRNRPEPQVTVNEGQPAEPASPTPDPDSDEQHQEDLSDDRPDVLVPVFPTDPGWDEPATFEQAVASKMDEVRPVVQELRADLLSNQPKGEPLVPPGDVRRIEISPPIAGHPGPFVVVPPLGGELVHSCNGGAGPKGGKKTPGCPRCDALLAGTIAPKGGRR